MSITQIKNKTKRKPSFGKVIGGTSLSQASERLDMDRRKDEFISIVSHELKTPLTSLQVFMQILEDKLESCDDTDSIKYVRRMEDQIERLNRLVDQLLDVSKIQQGKLVLRKERFCLDEFIRDAVEQIQTTTKKHLIIIEMKANNVRIRADKDRLYQVLFNLLANAIKYSPKNTKIGVTVSKAKDFAVVSVKDYGVGIAPEYQEKIFDRFFRIFDDRDKTFPGLGMGLYITQVIIKRHGGSLWVKSKQKKGSTFYFSLPLKNGY